MSQLQWCLFQHPKQQVQDRMRCRMSYLWNNLFENNYTKRIFEHEHSKDGEFQYCMSFPQWFHSMFF